MSRPPRRDNGVYRRRRARQSRQQRRGHLPRDTRQEAASVARLVGQATLMLVTSANHLPRAMGFFTAAVLKPLPAPANQLAISSPLQPQEKMLPSPLWLGHSERVWYETLGQVWQRLLGIAHRAAPSGNGDPTPAKDANAGK